MEQGKEEKPLTRKDLLRLIKENGGKAEGLDLSGRNLEGIDLSSRHDPLSPLDLRGINLFGANIQRASFVYTDLRGATLSDADLKSANLFGARLQDSFLGGANLQNANLSGAFLQGANLRFAKLQSACFLSANISQATDFEGAVWGDYILKEEKDAPSIASATYRRLEVWHRDAGFYDIAGEFYFREWECRRKAAWERLRGWKTILEQMESVKVKTKRSVETRLRGLMEFISLSLYKSLCGYGEKPEMVVLSAAITIFGLAGLYTAFGSFSFGTFTNCLYYSAASFTALGYGSWAPQPGGWAKGMGVAEAVLGVFMMALFLVTFTRKMVR